MSVRAATADPLRRALLSMLAAWMSERYFRTFRVAEREGEGEGFDAVLTQRERRVGVTVGALWEDADAVPGVPGFGEELAADLGAAADAGYAIWVPPGAELPVEEPRRSQLRLALARGLAGLEPGERLEVRLPVTLKLAKIQDDGAYVSVSGALSREWTRISEGVSGAFHLDARALHRLPSEPAEVDIVVSRVRDRAALLHAGELTDVQVHDYWTVSMLPADAPPGVAVIAAPPGVDPEDGTVVRRQFRRHVTRAVEQRRGGRSDLAVLVLVAALGHIEEELATAALRGMNPAAYGALDLIALAADGRMRQVLQPRALPWEQPR